MTNISERIKTLISEVAIAEKTGKYFNDLKVAYDQKLIENEALVLFVQKELEDVTQLEKMSVKGLFYKALGSKDAQLEKERQEYLLAALKQRNLAKELDLDKYEIELIGQKLDELKIKQAELEQLKKIREKEILSNPDESLHGVLRDITLKIDELHKFSVEINEAITVGNELINIFVSSLNLLKRAQNWGQWDMAGGRGYLKKSSIDKGLDEAYRAANMLERYKRELADIGLVYNGLNLQLGQVNSFMDIVFDNLLSDWIIQKKIKNAVATVESVFDKVRLVQQNVAGEAEKTRLKLEDMMRQKDLILQK